MGKDEKIRSGCAQNTRPHFQIMQSARSSPFLDPAPSDIDIFGTITQHLCGAHSLSSPDPTQNVQAILDVVPHKERFAAFCVRNQGSEPCHVW
jgi:hypothetical protein